MGNLNFQDEENPKPQLPTHSGRASDEPRVDDIFVDAPTTGTKFLWAAIIVIVIAGVAGGLYFLNKYGYLDFGNKQQTTTVNESAPVSNKKSLTNASVRPSGKFTLQIAAFRTRPIADDFIARLKRKGIDARVSYENGPNNEKWYKVYTGSFDTKLLAIAATEEMKKKVGTDVWVVQGQ